MQHGKALISRVKLFFKKGMIFACLKEAMAESLIEKMHLKEMPSEKVGIESSERGPHL